MAGKLNITIEKNATFRKRLRYLTKLKRAINLTGWTAKLQARTSDDSPAVVIELTTENGGITLTGAGYIQLHLSLAQVQALAIQILVYDLLMIPPSGEPVRLLEGRITVSQGVTTP